MVKEPKHAKQITINIMLLFGIIRHRICALHPVSSFWPSSPLILIIIITALEKALESGALITTKSDALHACGMFSLDMHDMMRMGWLFTIMFVFVLPLLFYWSMYAEHE